MRWDAQVSDAVDDAALPGLGQASSIPGLVRSTTTPEFAGLTFHEVLAKSALNAVPAASAMPFRWTVNPYRGCSHACVYCMSGDTLVLMADGSQRPLERLRAGDRVLGTRRGPTYRRLEETEVVAHWRTTQRAHRITCSDGTVLVAGPDHRFLTGRGWKYVVGAQQGAGRRPHLTTNDRLLGIRSTAAASVPDGDYRRGWLTGMVRGDALLKRYEYSGRGRKDVQHQFRLALADQEGLDRAREYLALIGVGVHEVPFGPAHPARRPMRAIRTSKQAHVEAIRQHVAWPDHASDSWHRGFLGGMFDAEGSRSRGVLRISNADPEVLDATAAAFERLGFDAVLEPPRANGVRDVRLRGGVVPALRFVQEVDPAIRRKCRLQGTALKNDSDMRVVRVEDLGYDMPMFDITTGTGDYVANGVVSHNCYARATHTYLDLDTGTGFDRELVVKTNVGEVLARELSRPTWRREHVALGTNTDPYQRAEGRYRLMPAVLTALARSGTPLSVLTKGTLLRRDLPLLVAAARDVPVGVGVSVAVHDEALHRSLEPGTPTPRARLDLVRAVRDAGLPCGVFMAPVLPGLTDTEVHLDAALAAVAAAGATGVTVLPLHLRPGAREWYLAWLAREHPELVPRYRALYRRGAYVPAEYRQELAARVAPLLGRHGLARQRGGAARGVDAERSGAGQDADFPAGSMPAVSRSEPAEDEQLSLL